MTTIQFPTRNTKQTVVTPMLRQVKNQTLRAHAHNAAMMIWTGQTDTGKTTAARWLTEQINESFEADPDNPNAYRAHHYETGRIPEKANNDDKRAVRSVYEEVLGTMDQGLYRSTPANRLAELVVRGLRRQHLELLLVDEAGLLSLGALRGMALVGDVAENEGWPLTICLIGMDDLPKKVELQPQISSRVKRWVFFQEYSQKETWSLLANLFPNHFEGSQDGGKREKRCVRFIHDISGGICGLFVDFTQQAIARCEQVGWEMTEANLKVIRTSMLESKEKAQESAEEWMKGDRSVSA